MGLRERLLRWTGHLVVHPQLDKDLDDLRARVAELERRLASRSDRE